ncbi:hypothetical protein ACFVVP_09675 [Streptomyces sp. NPDC058128]|uniref:hypothetical protein n=1 Tax=Streptomyces sp. NPDC058128 TaxID=3346352 RepID=UPI0036E1D79E
MKLQLSGQREDALWQSEADAYAELVVQFNKTRMQVGNVSALFSATRSQAASMAPYGFGTREEALKELMDLAATCA